METNHPCLTIDVISILGTLHPLPKHPERLLAKFDPDDDVLLEDHVKKFMIALNLMNVEYEDVVYILFPHTLKGKALTWFFNLALRSITSWKQCEEAFMA